MYTVVQYSVLIALLLLLLVVAFSYVNRPSYNFRRTRKICASDATEKLFGTKHHTGH